MRYSTHVHVVLNKHANFDGNRTDTGQEAKLKQDYHNLAVPRRKQNVCSLGNHEGILTVVCI